MVIRQSNDVNSFSSIKTNINTVQIKTRTLIPIKFSQNEVEYVYPISIGLKEKNYDDIHRKFISELEELKDGGNNVSCVMILTCKVYVYFELVATLGDQSKY